MPPAAWGLRPPGPPLAWTGAAWAKASAWLALAMCAGL